MKAKQQKMTTKGLASMNCGKAAIGLQQALLSSGVPSAAHHKYTPTTRTQLSVPFPLQNLDIT
eukprot:5272957-Amphidinium_carterae.1